MMKTKCVLIFLTVVVIFCSCKNEIKTYLTKTGDTKTTEFNTELFIYPTEKNIIKHYGWREDSAGGFKRFYEGIGLGGTTGTPVMAAMSGTVEMTGTDRRFGNVIIINHNDNYKTFYAHLAKLAVKKGDSVIQGDKIGEMGKNGQDTEAYLHFGIYEDGKSVNPVELLD